MVPAVTEQLESKKLCTLYSAFSINMGINSYTEKKIL